MNWILLKNSLLVSSLTTLLAVGFGLLAALWLAGLGGRWRALWFTAAVGALALPPFLVTNCWLDYLGQTGVWRSWFPFSIFSLGGTVWILSLLLWPITLIALISAWQRLEPSHLESDPAVTGWALIRGWLLPLGARSLAQAAVLTWVLALNNFAVPAILQVKVFPAEVWVRFNTTFDTLGALQLSWPLIVGPLILLLWLRRQDLPWPHLEGTVSAALFRRQLGAGWSGACGVATGLLCLLSLGLPLLQLGGASRTWTELTGALAAGQAALGNSILFSAGAAALVVGLGLLWHFALGPRNGGGPWAQFVGWLLWLPFLMPGVLLGIGLIAAFNRPAFALFYQSAGIVILALTLRYLAWGWHTVAHGMRSADRDLIAAARLEGASRWQLLRQVYWPQLAPQLAGAWYIVFLLCLWDVESMLLVVPPGGETLAMRVFNLLHYGHNAQVNALCLTLLLVALLPPVLWLMGRAMARARTSGLVALKLWLAAGFGLMLLAGCTPPSAAVRLESRLFSEVQVIGTRGVGIGQLNKPRSIAVDFQDFVYTVDMTGRVQKFTPTGAFVLSWQMPQTDLGKPKGMTCDPEGHIVVVEPHYQRVNHFSPTGQLVRQWGQRGTNAGRFMLPRAVAINSHGEIYVSEYGTSERVQRFSPHGETLLNSFGQAGQRPGDFNRPEGLCVDAQDRVYVADSCNHRIQVFTREGRLLRTYGRAGAGKGELSYPYDICVDTAGRQYVCEFGNSRIQVFDAKDRPLEIIGRAGAAPGQFNNPWGLALDSVGNLYVADALNHRVQKLVRNRAEARGPQFDLASNGELRASDFVPRFP